MVLVLWESRRTFVVLGVVICAHREDHDDCDVGGDGALNRMVMMKMLLIVMVVMLMKLMSVLAMVMLLSMLVFMMSMTGLMMMMRMKMGIVMVVKGVNR